MLSRESRAAVVERSSTWSALGTSPPDGFRLGMGAGFGDVRETEAEDEKRTMNPGGDWR